MNDRTAHNSKLLKEINLFKQDLNKSEIKDDSLLKSQINEKIGKLYFSIKNYKEGVLYLEKAIEIARDLDDKELEAQYLGSKGTEFLNNGLQEEGFLCFDEIITISKEIKNLGLQCDALGSIALVHLDTGEPGLAVENLKKALLIAEKLKDSKRIMHQVGTLGNTYLYLAAQEEAEKYFIRAIELAEKIGDKESTAGYLNNYAIILDNTGRKEEAKTKALQAQKLCLDIVHVFGERNALQLLIKLELEFNHQNNLIAQHLTRAIELSRTMGDVKAKNDFSDQLVLVLLGQNRQNEAIDFIQSELNNELLPALV